MPLMSAKTSQLQIRVSPEQKAALKRLADDAGVSVSQYVLSVALPSSQARFAMLAAELRDGRRRRRALAELRAFLSDLAPSELATATAALDPEPLAPVPRNYVAACVEEQAHLKQVAPPAWAGAVAPLGRPHFEWGPHSLRPHLMRLTPAAYKRRNLFVDAHGVESARSTRAT